MLSDYRQIVWAHSGGRCPMRPVPNLSHSVHQPRGIPVRLTDSGHVPNSGLYFREQTPNSVLSVPSATI